MTEQKCSREGCSEASWFYVIWRNPRIHRDGRTKIWASCEEHRDYLVDYLSQRNFFLETKRITEQEL